MTVKKGFFDWGLFFFVYCLEKLAIQLPLRPFLGNLFKNQTFQEVIGTMIFIRIKENHSKDI